MGRTVQKASLLGDGGDAVTGTAPNPESRAWVRRGAVPPAQSEYPIFTPGFREPVFNPSNKDPSRRSSQGFQASPQTHDFDPHRVWKEIHTDNVSVNDDERCALTPGNSFHTATQNSLSPGQRFAMLGSWHHNSPGGANRPAAALPAIVAQTPSRISISPRSKYLIPASSPAENGYIARHGSPASAGVAHPAQNAHLHSPHATTLPSDQRSPKPSQLSVASPMQTESGHKLMPPMMMTMMMSQNASSPDVARALRTLSDPPMSPTGIPAKTQSPSPPPQFTFSSPVSSVKSANLAKARHVKQDSHAAIPGASASTTDRSPGPAWKQTLRSTCPTGLSSLKDEAQDAMRGAAAPRDFGGHSFRLGSRRRPMGAPAFEVSTPHWTGCSGGRSAVAPAFERDTSGSSSSDSPAELTKSVSGKASSTYKEMKIHGNHYNMFNFLHWGKKKHSAALTKLHDLFPSDMGSVKVDSDSIKVLDYTIKSLRYKLEQASKERDAAASEVLAMQAAMEAADEKCRQLELRCGELELQLDARDFHDNVAVESENSKVHNRRRNGSAGLAPAKGRRFTTGLDVTPRLFAKTFEEAKACLRKLASAICHHIRDAGESATQAITALLEQHKVGRAVARMPRTVIILYFESFLNQVMFESFENVSFEPNGAASVFDPDALQHACCKAYQELKKLEWATIEKSLGKPNSVVVNANFHRFFVVRMEMILAQLGGGGGGDGAFAESDAATSPALMATFFNAVKSVWLLHHLAFAFDSPATLFRVAPAADFDPRFMEQVTTFEEEPVRSKISIMVNPGFIVNRQTIKCQVFCSSKYQ